MGERPLGLATAFPVAPAEPVEPDGHRLLRAELARELHDEVAQTLTTMVVQMENFKAIQYGRESVIRQLDSYQESTRDVLGNIRRLLFDLRGEPAEAMEFVPRLRRRLREYESRYAIRATLRVSANWPRQLAAQAAIHLSSIVEEALSNARRHGGASRVNVSLSVAVGQIAVLTVKDNGRGMELLWGESAGLGIIGMRERVLLLGGELQVLPTTPRGTVLKAAFPKERLI